MIFNRITNSIKDYGLKNTLILILSNLFVGDYLNFRKKIISSRLRKSIGNRIINGPFKGMIISENSFWQMTDFSSIILGFYERQVLDFVVEKCIELEKPLFINIGAADGFFAIGLIKNGFVNEAICFELTSKGRQTIKRNCVKNEIENSALKIFGRADIDFYKNLPSCSKNTIVLIDVEGFEFELLTNEALEFLKDSTIIVELHTHFLLEGELKLTNLIKRASSYFSVNFINSGARDPHSIKELFDFNENDKWLLCSEGRAVSMKWLVLNPSSLVIK